MYEWTSPTGISATVTVVSSGQAIKDASNAPSTKDVEAAVYAHIRAVRALGRTVINSAEISNALAVPVAEVEKALVRLKAKGIRIAYA